jgi:serine/threonine protein kinase
MPQSSAPPAIPDYRLLALIGRGSYGDVWLARGLTGPHRAIKVVWRRRFEDDTPYLRELLGLQHFAAVSLVESGQLALLHVGYNEQAGFFYYVMEAADDANGGPIDPRTYIPNTLSRALRRRKRIPAPQALAIAASLAGGLAGLHARGLVHRDIKPSNIIFVAGTAKLADIGTVESMAAQQNVTGTPGYVPREGAGTPAADVFSLGMVIYEIVMGRDRAKFPQLPEDLEDLPDRGLLLELNEIIAKACDPSPARRHADGSSLLD